MGNAAAREHAVVLGASMAGLLAATALAEHYWQVTVVDRDTLDPDPQRPRRGVPHGGHIHALPARGQQALDELLPGLTGELTSRGAPLGDQLGDARLCFGGHRTVRVTSGLPLLCASRPLVEDTIRSRVARISGVDIVPRCDVVELLTSADLRRVTGVRVRREGAEQAMPAALVVDATGRGSRIPTWLAAQGLPAPAEDRVKIGLGYATRTYRARPGGLAGDLGILLAPAPPAGRGGVLQVLEGDRWMVTLMGVLGDHPPTDPAGFAEFAASLPGPDIHDMIAGAQPLDDPVPFRFPAGVRRRYERLARFPDGLLVLGDAFCSLNPIYGHGMTVAALQALELRELLRHGRPPRPRVFHRRAARIVDGPWEMAAGGDLAFPGAEGHRTRKIRMINAYVGRMQAAAAADGEVATAFFRVAALVDPPQALLRPRIALRVLRGGRGTPVAQPAVSPPAVPDRHPSW
ncbi:MAG: FAD-binding monooxygenase [Pseudonocardiaceae bacterium]|nr:MAG: FAD-binding monooxygenase [Pseudonocardiaceae bacterium]